MKFAVSFDIKKKTITLSKVKKNGKEKVLVTKKEKKGFMDMKCALFASTDKNPATFTIFPEITILKPDVSK